jgi:hypothetical protein
MVEEASGLSDCNRMVMVATPMIFKRLKLSFSIIKCLLQNPKKAISPTPNCAHIYRERNIR